MEEINSLPCVAEKKADGSSACRRREVSLQILGVLSQKTSPKGIAATPQPCLDALRTLFLRVWGCWRLGQEPYLPAETNFLGENGLFYSLSAPFPPLWALGGSSTQAARGLHCSSPLLTLFWGFLHAKGFCSYHPYRAVTTGVGSDPQILGCLGMQLWQCILWPAFGLGW